jgi:hypothetical protein
VLSGDPCGLHFGAMVLSGDPCGLHFGAMVLSGDPCGLHFGAMVRRVSTRHAVRAGRQKLKVVAPSPIHCHSGTVPPISAPAMRFPESSFFAFTQIGHTR